MLTATPTEPLAPTETAVLPPTPSPILPNATPLPYPSYNGAPLDASQIGVQIHLRNEDQDALFAHLQTLGVGWVKVQVSWKLYEPFPDQLEQERLAELDQFITRANANNIRVLLGVSKAPEWSRPTTEMDGPPSDYALYRRFTAVLAQRYVGQVAAYELWNESNLQREWNGVPLSAADFVQLMREGAAGIRQHDPTALLISGAPATTGINDGITAVDDRVYLRQMLEAGVTEFVDGVGVHPYGAANPPDSTFAQPDPTTVSHNNHPSFFFLDTMRDYRALLSEFGSDLPLWPTEFGWGSFERVADAPPPEASFMANVTEFQQASYTLRAIELAQGETAVGPVFLWNLNFGPLLGTQFSESGYSILRPDGSPRPVYLLITAVLE